jgi:hypothetical protein
MRKLQLPPISERIRGFTIPESGSMYVSDYDEIHKVTLSDPPTVEWIEGNPYEFEETPNYLGVTAGSPILNAGGFTLSYEFDPKADVQDVVVTSPTQTETISFRTLSGDWFVATFSADAKYLVVAEPYVIEVYLLQ